MRTFFDGARFLNEARAVNLVRHPGLVEIYELGKTRDGSLYCIMEYLEGQTLAERLEQQRGPLPAAIAQNIAQKLAAALLAVHQKGIVHRAEKLPRSATEIIGER